jgi:hypothetical protein
MNTHIILPRTSDVSAAWGVALSCSGVAAIAFPIVTSIITVALWPGC